jgi:putative membrane protein
MSRLVRSGVALLAAAGASVAGSAVTLAHGAAPGPPDARLLVTGWSFDAHVSLPIALAFVAYRAAVRRVDAAHPASRVPRLRTRAWTAGLVTLLVALQSPIEAYDTTLFSVHMVQHLLLTMVAAPLLALGAPITLLLRVATPAVRKRWILPVLHSRAVKVVAFPVVAWIVFAGVMWASHFSPLFDAALEDPLIHVAEHALYLGAAMLFWWPVVGADPSPWRMPHPARVAYLFLGMPQSSFLGLALFSSPTVLYGHYASLERDWGPTALEDQQLAGGIMWAGGDALFLVGLILAIVAWLGHEEAEGRRVDANLERERARSARLAPPEPATADAPRGPTADGTAPP